MRGKTLGIVGYGHIGSQVGVLAEAIGMRVVFYDIVAQAADGQQPRRRRRSTSCSREADFVTLHVPETPQTKNMIGATELARMKKGAYLLNASRGTVVDIDALADGAQERPPRRRRGRRLSRGARDATATASQTPLRGLPNVILTPHIGGSTAEAQEAIGREVATRAHQVREQRRDDRRGQLPAGRAARHAAARTASSTCTATCPACSATSTASSRDLNANIHGQVLATDPNIGYLIMDLDQDVVERRAQGDRGARHQHPHAHPVLVRAVAIALVLAAAAFAARADEHACERTGEGFDGVTVVGGFASDLGCIWQAYLFQGKKHALMDAGALLAHDGWVGADGATRAALAKKFVGGVMLDRGVLLERAPDGFTGKFVPPHGTPNGDGTVLVVGWRRLPAGMQPGTRYTQLEVFFGSDGNIRTCAT